MTTLGTAGHVDHGKTALVAALTGVDTDRLPEEKARGLTIVLGYAPLVLPSGRRVSVVDVPGHERFVRTMVAGASGIDAYMMVVAADDGVMPQTVEHAEVLRALGVTRGVVAVTKCDVLDPARACAEAAELLPGASAIVACSARTGEGLDELRAALDGLCASVPDRASDEAAARLHVDRAFTVAGRGTVVTGTLWSGRVAAGDVVELVPRGSRVRVRGMQVHDVDVVVAAPGQRVALALAGVKVRDVARGDVVATPGTVAGRSVLDCVLSLRAEVRQGERVQVCHGTRDVAARLSHLIEDLWQLRLEQPLLACDGDRVVVRRLSPPDTLGGGTVLDAAAVKHGRRPEVLERLRRRRDGVPEPVAAVAEPVAAPPPGASVPTAALEARLRAAGLALVGEAELADDRAALAALRDAGRAVRVSGRLYAHADAEAAARSAIVALIEREGSTTLARVRDALGISRKPAQAWLEHLDAARVTRRLPDDARVLARRAAGVGG